MRSKTSFFNGTVFRKNLLRYAPVWGAYTLCLMVGILLLYTNGGTVKQFHFAKNIPELIYVMAAVNLVYALVVAELLFGDLFSSRMCNMLHAFPLRRENWFFIHVVSGFCFSLIPTAVMAILATPLLMNSVFENAWMLAWGLFLASNLQFVCFFGIAVFSAMCVGNRFTMAAGYGLLNVGAYIVYWLIDTVYTPMLYGVITPKALMYMLTPVAHMGNYPYIQIDSSLYDLQQIFGQQLKGAVATFTVTENWWRLWMLAGVGVGFALLGLQLYRIRNLECAGSAVAFPVLRPVFEVLCAVFVAAAGQFFLYTFTGMSQRNFLILTVGLAVGWFIGKMLTEHTSRVFGLKNFCGLAALAAVFAVSLWLTHVDILKIETRLPDVEKIRNVSFNGMKYTEREDIENFLRLQADALENRADNAGPYVLVDGEWIQYIDTNSHRIDEENPNNQYTYVDSVRLTYEMENGKLINRRYNIWVDNAYVQSEAGRIAEDYLTRWENVNGHQKIVVKGVEYDRLDYVMQDPERIYVDYMEDNEQLRKALATPENVRSLVEAIKADCAEGNMVQNYFYHTGCFQVANENVEGGYHYPNEIYVDINGNDYSWWICVYPDSVHTLNWLKSHGVLNAEVLPDNVWHG